MNTTHFKINFQAMNLKNIAYTAATFLMLILMTGISRAQVSGGTVTLRDQSLYGDNSAKLYWNSNHISSSQIVLRDSDQDIHGMLFGSHDGSKFGLVDADNNWSYLAVKDTYTSFYIDNDIKMIIRNTGNVGIGTTSPQTRLHLAVQGSGGLRIDGDNTGDVSMLLRNGTVNHYIFSDQSDGNCFDFSSQNNMAFNTDGANERMRILSTGEVAIGTTTVPTGYLVAIDGKLIAEEMRVKPSNFWDEVFETDYDLMSIEEKQKFTKINKHLPSFAPESEIVDEGMDVGKSFADVAKELEEAYLYIYQLNDKMKALEAQLAKLSEQSDK